MEVNKAKVLVYILTFVGYVWSGYGSSVLSNLRDAVLAAEHVFGDVVDNVVKAVNGFSEIHKQIDSFVDEDCVYKCPDGSTPVRNKYYKPTSNGCGPEGAKVCKNCSCIAHYGHVCRMAKRVLDEVLCKKKPGQKGVTLLFVPEVNLQYIPFEGITKCCIDHDLCYGTCNHDKEKCDLDFKRCLYNICDNFKSKSSDVIKTGCKLAAKGFFSATQTMGCPYYRKAQEQACYCSTRQQNKKTNEL